MVPPNPRRRTSHRAALEKEGGESVRVVVYPVLIGEMAKRKITKKDIAQSIGVRDRTLNNKLNDRTAFTWPEVLQINNCFFPDMELRILFQRADAAHGGA